MDDDVISRPLVKGPSFLIMLAGNSLLLGFMFSIGPWINPDYPYNTDTWQVMLFGLAVLFAGMESAIRRIEAALDRLSPDLEGEK